MNSMNNMNSMKLKLKKMSKNESDLMLHCRQYYFFHDKNMKIESSLLEISE